MRGLLKALLYSSLSYSTITLGDFTYILDEGVAKGPLV